MTIERIKGLLTAYCDACDEFIESDTGSFQDLVAELKGQGWTIARRSGDWEHYCKSCSEPIPDLSKLKADL